MPYERPRGPLKTIKVFLSTYLEPVVIKNAYSSFQEGDFFVVHSDAESRRFPVKVIRQVIEVIEETER